MIVLYILCAIIGAYFLCWFVLFLLFAYIFVLVKIREYSDSLADNLINLE